MDLLLIIGTVILSLIIRTRIVKKYRIDVIIHVNFMMVQCPFEFWNALLGLCCFADSMLVPDCCYSSVISYEDQTIGFRSVRILDHDVFICPGHCFGCSLLPWRDWTQPELTWSVLSWSLTLPIDLLQLWLPWPCAWPASTSPSLLCWKHVILPMITKLVWVHYKIAQVLGSRRLSPPDLLSQKWQEHENVTSVRTLLHIQWNHVIFARVERKKQDNQVWIRHNNMGIVPVKIFQHRKSDFCDCKRKA